MNDRVQKLMVNSLKMLKSRIDIEVVEGIEGQVEIIDLDLSIYNLNLLEDRLGQPPKSWTKLVSKLKKLKER